MDSEAGPSSSREPMEANPDDSTNTHSLVEQLTDKAREGKLVDRATLEQLLESFKAQRELQRKQIELLEGIVNDSKPAEARSGSGSEFESVPAKSGAEFFSEEDLERAREWDKMQRPDSKEILEIGKNFVRFCRISHSLWFSEKDALPDDLNQMELEILQNWPRPLGFVANQQNTWDLKDPDHGLSTGRWDVDMVRFSHSDKGGMIVKTSMSGWGTLFCKENNLDIQVPSGKLMYVVYTHVVPPGLLVLITNKMCWTLKSYSHCMTLKLIAFWPIHMHAHEMGNRTLMSVRAVDMMGLYLRPGQDGRQWSLEAAYIPGHYKYMFNVRFFTRESCQEVISEKETSSRYNSTSGGKLPSRMDFGPFLGQPGEILAERCFSIQVVTQTGTKTPWPNSIRLGSGAPVFTPRLLHDYHFKYGGQFVAMHIFVDDLETQLSGVCEHWSDELSGMNKKLGATLTDILDENTAHELMFDDKNFKRSKLYFTSQQLYRIFERCIGETLVELEMLQRDFLECEDMPGTKIDIKNVDGNIQTLDDHWTKAMAEPTKQLELILVRIKNKQEEVESLRDGLFNATSVREASRGTEIAEISIRQNHYLFVFTIMTVIYLPLGFVTSIFGMHLFDTTDSGVVAARPKFYITLVVLSVSTYITAGLAYWLVRSRKKNDSGSSNGLSNMLSKKQEQYADTELSEDGARNLEGGLSALLRKGIRKRKEKDIGTGRAKGKGKEASAMV